MFKDQNILVTGGTGLIGRPLVEELLKRGARVRIASLDDPERAPEGTEFIRADLTEMENCLRACEDMDIVFQLAGIKGSPAMTAKKPASFFVPTLSFNTNMMEAARRRGVKKYLYTSTIGVYSPAEVFHEDDVWKSFPSENDRFAGWAKRMGELQAEAYRIEYGWNDIFIVRPANVYGSFDNFDPANAMVVPSLIRRALDGENPLAVWGDGSPVRDLIHARDVAQGMILVMEKGETRPVNLGSGVGVRIKDVAEAVARGVEGAGLGQLELRWDTSKPMGDRKRLMDISRATALGFAPRISLDEGIRETIEWYRANRALVEKRYNVFKA